jgi:hypothetical protein
VLVTSLGEFLIPDTDPLLGDSATLVIMFNSECFAGAEPAQGSCRPRGIGKTT